MREEPLRPTLWRTCRILANRQRLKMLDALLRQPNQTVTAMAKRLGMGIPQASRCLRELNARGLLKAARSGTWVTYRIAPDPTVPQADALIRAIRQAFRTQNDPITVIFRMATAFTHPRRVDIVLRLRAGPLARSDLRLQTGISSAALTRHLAKLRSRGFVRPEGPRYSLARPESPLQAALLALATAP